MDHAEAASAHAVERYLLGEMNEAEAESFELHFFECTTCADEVASGAILAENLKAVAQTESAAQPVIVRPEKKQYAGAGLLAWWRRPLFALPAFASLILAFTVAYQARELARLNQPQAIFAFTLSAGARGGPAGSIVPAGRRNLELRLDLPDASYAKYRCELTDQSGRSLFSVDAEKPRADDQLSLSVPKGLPPGDYTLKIQGLRDAQAGPAVQYRIRAVNE